MLARLALLVHPALLVLPAQQGHKVTLARLAQLVPRLLLQARQARLALLAQQAQHQPLLARPARLVRPALLEPQEPHQQLLARLGLLGLMAQWGLLAQPAQQVLHLRFPALLAPQGRLALHLLWLAQRGQLAQQERKVMLARLGLLAQLAQLAPLVLLAQLAQQGLLATLALLARLALLGQQVRLALLARLARQVPHQRSLARQARQGQTAR